MASPAVAVPGRLRVQARAQLGHGLALAIVIGYLIVFFFLPLTNMIGQSLHERTGGALTTAVYGDVFGSGVYLQVIVTTLRLSIEVTLITLLLSYPLAVALSSRRPQAAAPLLVLVVIPYFTSTLVRTYAWMVILGQNGLVNGALQAIGVTHDPIQFLYNEFGVLIGLVYVFMPFMILVLYAVMRGIDPDYMRAAASSGAGPIRSFVRVYLPLSMPGVVAGSLLTFVMSIGSYITPALMGGPKQTMISMTIQQALNQLLNWGLGAALAVVLLLIVAVAYFAYDRVVGMARLFESSF